MIINLKLQYLELNEEVQCYGKSELNLIETENYLPIDTRYDEIQPIIQCAFGYFRFQDQCIKCPSASQKGSIQCLECFLYPDTWVQSGECFQQYQQLDRDERNIYQHFYDHLAVWSGFYLFVDEELFSCDNCEFCSREEYLEDLAAGVNYCVLFPLKHIFQDIAECKISFGFQKQSNQRLLVQQNQKQSLNQFDNDFVQRLRLSFLLQQ